MEASNQLDSVPINKERAKTYHLLTLVLILIESLANILINMAHLTTLLTTNSIKILNISTK